MAYTKPTKMAYPKQKQHASFTQAIFAPLEQEPLASIWQNIRTKFKAPSLGKHKSKAKKLIALAICFELISFWALRVSPLGDYLEAQIEPLYEYILHNSSRVSSVQIMPKTAVKPNLSRIISQDRITGSSSKFASKNLAQTLIIMASDGPFAILSSGDAGEFQFRIHKSGQANNTPFGSLVQYDGPLTGCGKASSASSQVVFSSNFATAPNTGEVIDQAVLLEIVYDHALNPDFVAVSLSEERYKEAMAQVECSPSPS